LIKVSALSEIIVYLPTASDHIVQAVEKPQKPAKFGKIGHQNQGDADGQIYPLRLQPKPHGCDQFSGSVTSWNL